MTVPDEGVNLSGEQVNTGQVGSGSISVAVGEDLPREGSEGILRSARDGALDTDRRHPKGADDAKGGDVGYRVVQLVSLGPQADISCREGLRRGLGHRGSTEPQPEVIVGAAPRHCEARFADRAAKWCENQDFRAT
jgi:hypothetical protein